MTNLERFALGSFFFAVGVAASLCDLFALFGLMWLAPANGLGVWIMGLTVHPCVFLGSILIGPAWAALATYLIMRRKGSEVQARVKGPAVVGYGLAMLGMLFAVAVGSLLPV